MTELLTGTVTLLFTDIEGSTELVKRLGKRYGEVLADQRRILRAAAREHGGDEVDTQGDSFLFAFQRADEAAGAAVDAQRALTKHEWPDGTRLRVRMGLHTAEPSVSDEGYYGLGVHRAARIMGAAHGGQVLVSRAAYSVLEDADLPGVTLLDLGDHWLKDLDRPERLYHLEVAGLTSSFPPPRSLAQPRPASERTTAADDVELLERSDALSTLGGQLAEADAGEGRLTLVAGEAGVGKTALLRRFCDQHRDSVRILWGACDALFTPRPLGPLLDVAEAVGGELAEVVREGGKPHAVATALIHELGRRGSTVLVLEDAQWADEATLDVVALLGRRIESVPALVLLSYRRDEIDRSHPLRLVLGSLATAHGVARLAVLPLSPEAVTVLAEPHGANAGELFRRTGGNPFFATEALAAGNEEIPPTVRDAVLARAARVSAPAAELLEAVAIVTPPVELWLLDRLAGDVAGHLDECLSSGMLTEAGSGIAFRHELARRAVEDSLGPTRRLALHRKALDAFAEPPAGAPDVERVAHHADAAGDAEAVLRFAPAAAERAAALGAHREAAEQYARALRFAGGLPADARAVLLARYSLECYLTDQPSEAIKALSLAIECHRDLGDARMEGDTRRRLANILWCPGRTTESNTAIHEALRVLEPLPPGPELAMAYATMAQLRKDDEDFTAALEWGARAYDLARSVGGLEAEIHALNTIGTTELLTGNSSGLEKLERSLEQAEHAGLAEPVGRAFVHLVLVGMWHRDHALADRYLDRGLSELAERGLDLWRSYLFAARARIELDRGQWDAAVASAQIVFEKRPISTFPRIHSFVVLALVRARRGDPDVQSPLAEALALAEPTGELPRIAPVAAALAEAAWLAGDAEGVARATDKAFELARARNSAWPLGELACWRRRAGLETGVVDGAAEPYAAELAGDWARAAELWSALGCPYEAALALAAADDEGALRRSLAELQRLGAQPAVTMVARRLREHG
jgi:class 3 adenylate cyclase/tetratricopeptide (TPR) repeat protein